MRKSLRALSILRIAIAILPEYKKTRLYDGFGRKYYNRKGKSLRLWKFSWMLKKVQVDNNHFKRAS